VAYDGVDVATLLQRGMQVAEMNHRYIANNIANIETPNYNPTKLDFHATLKAMLDGRGRVSLRRTQPRHIELNRDLPVTKRVAISSKNDYNKVDLDQEMADLAENTGRYMVYGSLLTKRFQIVKNMLANLR
jgi:flagellar basal-body rod protein FlgB